MHRRWLLSAVTWAGMLALATAQDEKAKPAAPAEAGVPAGFRALVVVDDRYPPKAAPAGKKAERDPRDRTLKIHDLVTEQGLNPVVAVFSRTLPKADDAPVTKLIRQLDAVALKHRGNNLAAFVGFLTLDKEFPQDERRTDKGEYLRDEQLKAVRDLGGQLKAPRVVLALAAGRSPTLDAWGVSPDDDVVVVLYHKMRVVQRWAFKAGGPSDDEIKAIIDAADKEGGRY